MNAAERLGAPGWLDFLLTGKFWWLYGGILLYIYGGMFFLGFALEGGRVLPIWSGQYRSFIPGDFFLAAGIAAGLVLAHDLVVSGEDGWWQSKLLHVGAAGVGFLVASTLFMVQASTEEKADPGLFFSPTRIFHQLLIWGPGVYIVLAFVLPAVVHALRIHPMDVYVLMYFVGILGWAGFMAWDGTHPPQIDPEQPLHDRFDVTHLLRFGKFWADN